PVGVAESVGVDFAQRVRGTGRGELVGLWNSVVAEAFHAARDRRAARIDAQDGGYDRIETLRLRRVALVRPAAVAEPMITAADVEQPVVGVPGLHRRVELD